MSFILQHKFNDCSIACAINVLRYFNIQVPYKMIASLMGKDNSFYSISLALANFGVKSNTYNVKKEFFSELAFDVAIMQIKEFGVYHFILCYKNANKLKIFDSAWIIRRKINKRLLKKWTGYLMICHK